MSATNLHQTEINLFLITKVDTEIQMQVREIRNENDVRKWMYTDHVIGVTEHLEWINHLKKDNKQMVFVVMGSENSPLGVVSLDKIDTIHKKSNWAYYLANSARGTGLGSALEYSLINFVFDSLNLEKLNCEVIEGNNGVIKLHKKFMFKEEGFRRADIIKENIRIGTYVLGLTKNDWQMEHEAIFEKYQHVLDKFLINIHWQDDLHYAKPKPIDEIEFARAKNNLNWMSILKLAIEKSPTVAKPIIAEIQKMDKKITTLTNELIKDI